MAKRRSSNAYVNPIPRSSQMDDLHLVYADPEMGDPCELMIGGTADCETLDESHPDLRLEQQYFDRVVAVSALGRDRNASTTAAVVLPDDVDARTLVVGRVDLADGARRYIGCEDLNDACGTSLVVNWLSDQATPFYRPDRSDPELVIRKRVFRIEDRRIVQILDVHYRDTTECATTTNDSTAGQSRRRQSGSRRARTPPRPM